MRLTSAQQEDRLRSSCWVARHTVGRAHSSTTMCFFCPGIRYHISWVSGATKGTNTLLLDARHILLHASVRLELARMPSMLLRSSGLILDPGLTTPPTKRGQLSSRCPMGRKSCLSAKRQRQQQQQGWGLAWLGLAWPGLCSANPRSSPKKKKKKGLEPPSIPDSTEQIRRPTSPNTRQGRKIARSDRNSNDGGRSASIGTGEAAVGSQPRHG